MLNTKPHDPDAAVEDLLGSRAAWTQLRQEMLRFAVLQLRNQELAEDVVQDTITAALTASDRFARRATVKTWIFSILKNKIVDVFRDKWRNQAVHPTSDAQEEEIDFDILFQPGAHWQAAERPSSWGNPESTLENQQFWQIFDLCLNNLPESTARVFFMREFLGLEVPDICKELQISSSNCWVILHRARMGLRLCLQKNWFQKDETL